MIELGDITFAYPRQEPLFRGFSWRIEAGEMWSVVGPSGCGKTTLLLLLAGLLRPAAGRVGVDGQVLRTPQAENGLVFQSCELLPWATVRANVELGLRIRRFHHWRQGRPDGLGRREIRDQAGHWLDKLGLAGVADRYPSQISGGQRQRAAIARTLATKARRLLMDEPFSALDVRTREALRRETLELCREQGLSLVLVTHSIEEAVLMGQRILVLGAGCHEQPRMVENGHDYGIAPANDAAWQRRCAAVKELIG